MLDKIIKEQQQKIAEARRGKKRMPHYTNCVYLTQLTLNQIHPSLTLLCQPQKRRKRTREKKKKKIMQQTITPQAPYMWPVMKKTPRP